ncbi:MAG TPA: hypothetical protein VM098_07980 [Phycisphaerae bacterium]|nr:hypothetical protein [Phycisphaerae bacterium]
MTEQDAQRRMHTRRELFTSAGRYAALAGIAALAWLLGGRGKQAPPRGSCTNDGLCRSCSKLQQCILPAAQYTRRAKGATNG